MRKSNAIEVDRLGKATENWKVDATNRTSSNLNVSLPYTTSHRRRGRILLILEYRVSLVPFGLGALRKPIQ